MTDLTAIEVIQEYRCPVCRRLMLAVNGDGSVQCITPECEMRGRRFMPPVQTVLMREVTPHED